MYILSGLQPGGPPNTNTNGNSDTPPAVSTTITTNNNSKKRTRRPKHTTNNPIPTKSPRRTIGSHSPTRPTRTARPVRPTHTQPLISPQQQRHQRHQQHLIQQNQQQQRNIRDSLLHQPHTPHTRQAKQQRLQQLEQQHHQLSQSQPQTQAQAQQPQQQQSQQRQQGQVQAPEPTHSHTTTYFGEYSPNHKSTLNMVFNGLSQDIKHYKSKGIIVGMKMEILNHIIQNHRKSNQQSTFIDNNGQSQGLTFKNFVNDKYVGDGNGQFDKESDIKNIRQYTKYYYDKRQTHTLFNNVNQILFQEYEQALQSNVKYIIFVFL